MLLTLICSKRCSRPGSWLYLWCLTWIDSRGERLDVDFPSACGQPSEPRNRRCQAHASRRMSLRPIPHHRQRRRDRVARKRARIFDLHSDRWSWFAFAPVGWIAKKEDGCITGKTSVLCSSCYANNKTIFIILLFHWNDCMYVDVCWNCAKCI